jgi:uncharacterized membrane protein YdbT with pleckstrin-like domain
MDSSSDPNLIHDFENILSIDERILWGEKPKFLAYFILEINKIFGFIIVFFVVFTFYKSLEEKNSFELELYLFFFIGTLFFLYNFFKSILSFRNTYYVYTNLRVMIKSGALGFDIVSLEYAKISSIELKINFIEKLFKVGSIRFFSGKIDNDEGNLKKIYDSFESISNPTEVFKQINIISNKGNNKF